MQKYSNLYIYNKNKFTKLKKCNWKNFCFGSP